MAKVTITAEFDLDPSDPHAARGGPRGLYEALDEFGLSEIEIEAEDED